MKSITENNMETLREIFPDESDESILNKPGKILVDKLTGWEFGDPSWAGWMARRMIQCDAKPEDWK